MNGPQPTAAPAYPADKMIPKYALQGVRPDPGTRIVESYWEQTGDRLGPGFRRLLKRSHTKRQRRFNKRLAQQGD